MYQLPATKEVVKPPLPPEAVVVASKVPEVLVALVALLVVVFIVQPLLPIVHLLASEKSRALACRISEPTVVAVA